MNSSAQIVAWHREQRAEPQAGEDPRHRAARQPARWWPRSATRRSFENGRQVSAWLGLVPRQNSSGGKSTLARDQQTRRCLPAHAADPRRPLGHLGGQAPERVQEPLAGQPAEPTARQYRCCGAGQQERSNRMGAARPRAATSSLTTCRYPPLRSQNRYPQRGSRQQHTPPIAQAITHVMAKQVRPWLAESSLSAALGVRGSEWEPASRFHQGQRHTPQRKSGCTGAISPRKPSRTESLARLGASMYG